MACSFNNNLCHRKDGYCEFAPYCVRLHEKLRKKLLEEGKGKELSAIDIEKFKYQGSGRKCTKT